MDEDSIIDALPAYLQSQVLKAIEVQEDGSVRRRKPPRKTIGPLFAIKLILSALWAFPFAAAGLILCLTVFFAPIGIAIIAFGDIPLVLTIRGYIKRSAE